MKVAVVVALLVVHAIVVKAAKDVCALDAETVKTVIGCVREKISEELKTKLARFYKDEKGVEDFIKKQCEADVKLEQLLPEFFSEKEIEEILKLHDECIP